MKKLLVFNWKMNPRTLEEAEEIARASLEVASGTKEAEVVVCPPFVYLEELSKIINHKSPCKLGSQDVFWESDQGAFTGEISDAMLKDSGAEYVIVGHSERRKLLGETDLMVNKKLLAILKDGLIAILCIGEELVVRQKGIKAVKDFVKNQLEKDLAGIEDLELETGNLVIAYEPIWAIGTGVPCEPKDALEIIKFIKGQLKTSALGGSASGGKNPKLEAVRVLYGGSVTGKNIMDFVKYKEIDGALVGGASLNPSQFKNLF